MGKPASRYRTRIPNGWVNLSLVLLLVAFVAALRGIASYIDVGRNGDRSSTRSPPASPSVPSTFTQPTSVSALDQTLEERGSRIREHRLKYTDEQSGISFDYPSDWVHFSPSIDPSVVSFKPADASSEEMEGYVFCVSVGLLLNHYDNFIQGKRDEYELEEPVTIARLAGVHFRGPNDGYYILDKDGRTIEFHYVVIGDKSYGKEARRMAESLTLL